MHSSVKHKVIEAGFEDFIKILGQGKKRDRPLLIALVERWRDTTHTFHFDNIGDMMMTPMDFSAITGLRVSRNPLKYDMLAHLKKNLELLFGKPVAMKVDNHRIRTGESS